MRDRMERFTAFPFSTGCISNSSVDVVGCQPEKSRSDQSNAVPTGELVLLHSNGKMKTSFPKPNISAGIHKVLNGFKNLSYMFQFYNKGDDDDDDEEREMVIGLPTDVQHVAHIGWDGFNSTGSTTATKSRDHKAPDLLSLPSISLRQFELAMAAHADAPPHQTRAHGPIPFE